MNEWFPGVDPRLISLCVGAKTGSRRRSDGDSENRKDAFVRLLTKLHTHDAFTGLVNKPYDEWTRKEKSFVKETFRNLLIDIGRPDSRYRTNTFDESPGQSEGSTDNFVPYADYLLGFDLRVTTVKAHSDYETINALTVIKEALRSYTPVERFILLQAVSSKSHAELAARVEKTFGMSVSVVGLKNKLNRLRKSLKKTVELGYRPDCYSSEPLQGDVSYIKGRVNPLTGRLTRGYHNYTGDRKLSKRYETLMRLVRSKHSIEVPLYFHRKITRRDPSKFNVCWYVSLVDALNETVAGAGLKVFETTGPMIYERYNNNPQQFFETTASEVVALKQFRIISPDFHQLSELTFRNLVRQYEEEADWA